MTSRAVGGDIPGADLGREDRLGEGWVHVLSGYVHRGGWSQAVCRCGHPGPARQGRVRAAVALDRTHPLDALACAWCERIRGPVFPPIRPEAAGLVVYPVGTGPWPGVEHLACADDPACAPTAAAHTRRYAASAAAADAYCAALIGGHPAAPVLLRVITGG